MIQEFEARVGNLVEAPVKRDGQRHWVLCRVTWVSNDGKVLEVESLPRKAKGRRVAHFRAPFARSSLRRATLGGVA